MHPNNRPIRPLPPLPALLRGSDKGSFAEYTITTRFPTTVHRVIAENQFSPAVVRALHQLIEEIPHAGLRPISDGAADNAAWAEAMAPYDGQTWLTAPWLPVEIYFYRRILELIDYFRDGPSRGHDPFGRQKEAGLRTTAAEIAALAERTADLRETTNEDSFNRFVQLALWGNQADLSLFPAGSGSQPTHADEVARQAHTLADDSPAVWGYLAGRERPLARIDIILDNAGFELVADLLLADFFLGSGGAHAVRLHAKPQPFFVSDAMPKDVGAVVTFLQGQPNQAVRALGGRLADHRAQGRLQVAAHPFWALPYSMWQMPAELQAELAASNLLISKGDANYRRWLGDRHWPFTTPFPDVVAYTPAPLLALRTLKSNVAAGLPAARVNALEDSDETDWLTGGRYGLLQFATGRAKQAGQAGR